MAGERGCFACHAFHHVAVAAEGIDVEIEQRKIRPVKPARKPTAADRHADAVAAALPERAGRRLDARRETVFRMTGTAAAELAKSPDVVEADGRPACLVGIADPRQMQKGVEQHRGMAVRQHEAVAIAPFRIVAIEAERILPQRIGHRRQRHRRARVAGFCLLHRIHRQRADRIDAQPVEPRVLLGGLARGGVQGLAFAKVRPGHDALRDE